MYTDKQGIVRASVWKELYIIVHVVELETY